MADTLYVTNGSDLTISVIDIATNLVTATVSTSSGPYNLAVTPDLSKLIVSTSAGIEVFSLPSMTPLQSVALATDLACLTATNTTAYVCGGTSHDLVTVDLTTWATGSITMTGGDPTNIVLSRDGTKLYTDSDDTNQVWVVDVGTSTPSLLYDFTGTTVCEDGLAISADGTVLYVGGNDGVYPLTLPSGTPGSVIATAGGSQIADIQIGQSGAVLWALDGNNNTFQPIPTPSGPAGATTAVTHAFAPQAGALSPDESTLYVTDHSFDVQIIDTSTGLVTGSISVGGNPNAALVVPSVTPPTAVAQYPLISVQIATGGTYWSPSDWIDISRYVQDISVTRGRQHELQRVEAASAKITLTNQDGRFSPWNTGGPYYPALTPSTPLKILATWKGTTYDVFHGAVSSWVPKYGKVRAQQVITAYDSLKVMSAMALLGSSYVGQVIEDGASLYWRLTDPPGSGTAADQTGSFPGAVSGPVTFGQPGPLYSSSDTAAAFGFGASISSASDPVSSATAITVEFWAKLANAFTFWGGVRGVSLGSSSISGFQPTFYSGSTPLAITTGTTPYDGAYHYYAFTYDNVSGDLTIMVDGVVRLAGTTTTGLLTTDVAQVGVPEATVGQFAVYPTALTPGDLFDHYKLGSGGFLNEYSGQLIEQMLLASTVPSSAFGAIATGKTLCQPPTVTLGSTQLLATIQTVENTEQGFFFVDEAGLIQYYDRDYVNSNPSAINSNGTFSSQDTPGTYPIALSTIAPGLDDVDLWNDVPVQSQTGALQEWTDPTSEDDYGRRTLTGYTGMLMVEDSDALYLAQYLITQYSRPIVRVRSIGVDSTARDGSGNPGLNFPQMLGRKLLDAITVEWQPIDGSASLFTQTSNIEKITHTITPWKWTTVWGLAPSKTAGPSPALPFFILNDPVRGRLNDNVLGF